MDFRISLFFILLSGLFYFFFFNLELLGVRGLLRSVNYMLLRHCCILHGIV